MDVHVKPLNEGEGKNKFRFQKFAERLENVDVDVFHKVAPVDFTPADGAQSFFQAELVKVREINCTAALENFYRKVVGYSQSAALVLHHKDEIMDAVLEALSEPKSLAFNELLGIIVSLAKDLQSDFYAFLHPVLDVLGTVLDPLDSSAIENVFQTIAYLFKFLTKFLVTNLEELFRCYVPFVAHNKLYIRMFAAESFAYLLRKIKTRRLPQLIATFMTALEDNEEFEEDFCHGMGMLLFESVKGVKQQLHSRMPERMKAYLDVLGNPASPHSDKNRMIVAVTQLYNIVKHTTSETCTELWTVLLKDVNGYVEQGGDDASFLTRLGFLVRLLAQVSEFRFGGSIADPKQLLGTVGALVGLVMKVESAEHPVLVSAVLSFAAGTFARFGMDDYEEGENQILEHIFEIDDTAGVLGFCYLLKDSWLFDEHLVSHAVQLCIERADQDLEAVVWFMARLHREGYPRGGRLIVAGDRQEGSALEQALRSVLQESTRQIKAGVALCEDRLSLIWAVLQSLQSANFTLSTDDVLHLLREGRTASRADSKRTDGLRVVCGHAVATIATMVEFNAVTADFCAARVKECLALALGEAERFSIDQSDAEVNATRAVLDGVHAVLTAVQEKFPAELSVQMQVELLSQGFGRLMAHISESVRTAAVKILAVFGGLPGARGEPCLLFKLCQNACEDKGAQKFDMRSRELILEQVAAMATSPLCPEEYRVPVLHFFLGLYNVKLHSLWPAVTRSLVKCADRDFSAFWAVAFAYLENVCELGSVLKDGALPAPAAGDTGKKAKVHVRKKRGQKFVVRIKPTLLEDEHHDTTRGLAGAFAAAIDSNVNSTDNFTIFKTLLGMFAEVAQETQRKSADIVPLFLDKFLKEYDVVFEKSGANSDRHTYGARGTSNAKLVEWLSLFSHFSNAKGLVRGSDLNDVFHRFLGHADNGAQKAAFQCLLLWKPAYLTPYSERILRLIEESTFRNELTLLHADMDNAVVLKEHRPGFIHVITRLLHAKLVGRRGRSSAKRSMAARRSTILSFFASLSEEEAASFFDMLLAPFCDLLNEPSVGSVSPSTGLLEVAADIPLNKCIGFLRLLPETLRCFGSISVDKINKFFSLCVAFVQSATQRLDEIRANKADGEAEKDDDVVDDEDDDVDDEDDAYSLLKTRKQLAQTRILAIKGLASLFLCFQEHTHQGYAEALFETIAPSIKKIHLEGTQHPSALLEFFVAMSKSPALVSYLCIDENIIPNSLKCLVAPKVHTTVVSAVLSFMESLLRLREAHPESHGELIESLLRPHLQLLLDSLQKFVESTNEISIFAKRELGILSKIGDLATSPQQATTLAKLLLPFVTQRGTPDDAKRGILSTVANLLHLLTPDAIRPHYAYLSKLFKTLTTRGTRLALCDVFTSMTTVLPDLQDTATFLCELNCFTVCATPEPDYDRRLEAYTDLIENKKLIAMSYEQVLPIVYVFMCDMYEDELALRTTSAFGLTGLVEHIGATADKSTDNKTLRSIVTKVIAPEMKVAVRHTSVFVRGEYLKLLSVMLPLFEEVYPTLTCLLHRDPEVNFFNNITHLQLPRKIKAMKRCAEKALAGELKGSVVAALLIPLFAHYFFEGFQDGSHNVADHAVYVIGSLCGQLTWGPYIRILRQYLHLIPSKPLIEKQLIRLVCSILDNFHFDVSSDMTDSEDAPPEQLVPRVKKAPTEEEGEGDDDNDDVEGEDAPADTPMPDAEEDVEDVEAKHAIAKHTRKVMVKSILPEMYRFLSANKSLQVVRVQVTLAIIKVLLLLPTLVMHYHLPRVLISVCQHLRSKEEDERDITRTTLVHVSEALGPRYFKFIVLELRNALQRGYQVHILGYTVHALLKSLLSSAAGTSGCLDYCVDMLMEVIIEDIFGTVAEEKEVSALAAKMKETKQAKSRHSVELLGRLVGVNGVSVVLKALRGVLGRGDSLKTARTVAEVLKHYGMGLHGNATMDASNVLLLAHNLIQPIENAKTSQKNKGGTEERPGRPASKKVSHVEIFKVQPSTIKEFRRRDEKNLKSDHVLIAFGLQLFTTALKRQKIDLRDSAHLGMMDPFVSLLTMCLHSSHDHVVSLALRALTPVVSVKNLPSLPKYSSAISKRVFQLAKRSGARKEISPSAFKLLATLIRETETPISESDVKVLISYAMGNLEQPTTFTMIKAIIQRKVAMVEVYDLMKYVCEQLVQHASEAVRELCRQSFLQFLLFYPLGKRRLKQHIEFLLSNLGFAHQGGRESVLDMLHKLVAKFPDEVLSTYAEMMFLGLSTRLINETEADVRAVAGVVVKALLIRVSSEQFDSMFTLILTWYDNTENIAMQRLGAQILGIGIEVLGKGFDSRSATVMEALDRTISSVVEGDGDEEMIPWETVYYSLTACEKAITNLPSLTESDSVQEILRLASSTLLEHSHAWVRLVSMRILGLLFAQRDPAKIAAKGKGKKRTRSSVENELLNSAPSLRDMARRHVQQMSSDTFDDRMGEQTVKNLVFLCRVYHANPELGAKAIKVNDDGTAETPPEDLDHVPSLMWIVRKLGYMASQESAHNKGTIKRMHTFRFFAALANALKDDIEPYLFVILKSLYRSLNSQGAAASTEETTVRELAQEVREFISTAVDNAVFVKTYNNVRAHVTKTRGERKKAQAVLAVSDPKAHARRKSQKNAMKRDARKRKAAGYSDTRARKKVRRAKVHGLAGLQNGA